MNRTNISYTIIVLLIVVNLLIISKYKKEQYLMQELLKKSITIDKRHNLLVESIEYRLVNRIQSEGLYVGPEIFNSIDIGSKIILRINTESCQACIDKIHQSIEKLEDNLKSKIIVLGSFNNSTEYEYYRLSVFKKIKVLYLKNEFIVGNVIEKSKQPYFFTIDENNRIHNVFIPDKNFMFLTDIYLKKVIPCTNQSY